MMRAAAALLEKIIDRSQIPSGKRRREVERELRGHIEDFVMDARGAGYGEDEIERMAIESFGDPLEVARNFGWVYRHERALQRLWVFGLSTAAVAILIAAGTLAVQAGVAAGFGVPFSGRHSMIEAWDILATVAVYMGMISVERAFPGLGNQANHNRMRGGSGGRACGACVVSDVRIRRRGVSEGVSGSAARQSARMGRGADWFWSGGNFVLGPIAGRVPAGPRYRKLDGDRSRVSSDTGWRRAWIGNCGRMQAN